MQASGFKGIISFPDKITVIDDLDAFKRALYNKFLQKMPDKPPVKGSQYARVNTNSRTDWRLEKKWCPDMLPLSGLADGSVVNDRSVQQVQ